jgi:hypothetical protein
MSGAELFGERKLACEVRRIELVRFDAGELAGAEATRIQSHVGGCAHCQGILNGMKSARAALGPAQVTTESVAILEKLDAPRPSPWLAWLKPRYAGPVLAGVIAVIAIVPLALQGLEEHPRIRTKGASEPALEMWINTPEGAKPAADGAVLGEGAQIQFRYRASGRQYLWVVSVDGKGVTTPLYPDQKGPSLTVVPDGTHVLEGSVILDDAKGPERIFGFFSEEPLTFEEIEARLKAALPEGTDLRGIDTIDLGQRVTSESVLIIKE